MRSWYRIYIVVTATLLSLCTRIFGDALHIPGYYDSTEVYLAASLLPLPWTILASLTTTALLTLYYKVYIIASWILVLAGIVAWVFFRRISGYWWISYLVLPLIYGFSWILLYALVSHTTDYILLFLRMRGFYILLFDTIASITIAQAISKTVVQKLLAYDKLNYRHFIPLAIIAIVLGFSYISITINEWGVVYGFTDNSGYYRFHTKWILYGYL